MYIIESYFAFAAAGEKIVHYHVEISTIKYVVRLEILNPHIIEILTLVDVDCFTEKDASARNVKVLHDSSWV